jgi:hypothetical protein
MLVVKTSEWGAVKRPTGKHLRLARGPSEKYSFRTDQHKQAHPSLAAANQFQKCLKIFEFPQIRPHVAQLVPLFCFIAGSATARPGCLMNQSFMPVNG